MPPEQKPQNDPNNSIPVREGLDAPELLNMIETETTQTALENQALDALSFARADEASLEPTLTEVQQTVPLTADDLPKVASKYRFWAIRGSIVALALLLVGLGGFAGKKAMDYRRNVAKQGSVATNYATSASPLNDLANQSANGLSVVTDSSARLTVNGTLNINGSLIINQSGKPAKPTKGQIYYSKTDNKLYFYNGISYIDITYASSVPASVSSVQGLTGAVNFTGGRGISVTGTTISSTLPTGVQSLLAGSANISITSDGNGGYTITDANGGVGVELQNSTPGSPQTGNINITGTMIAGSFQGDGSGLTNLNASNVASGTLDDARLSTNVTLAGNTFNGVNQLVQLDGSGFLPALNGSALTALNASNIASGTLADARLSANVTLQGNIFNGANQLVKLNPSGDLPALSGINLTNLNASAVTAGTLPDARLSSNVTLMGNTFNGANQLLQLTNLGYLPVINGSNVTALDASNISAGTLNDARLSANVALLNGNQTFSGSNTFSSAINANTITPSGALTVGATGQAFTLQGNGSSVIRTTNGGFTTTIGFVGLPIGNVAYNFDRSITAGTYTICTTFGNCAGTGGGVTTPGGTANKLARFTGSQTIGDSAITDTGAIVTIQNSSDSINGFQIQNSAGTSNLFVADTTNTRIGIGMTSPAYTLDVNGDINSATGLRVAGNLVCDASGCIAGGGSGFYIQNSTSLQTAANFNIESTSPSVAAGVVRGTTGQTADIFQVWQGASLNARFMPSGNLSIGGVYMIGGSQIASSSLADFANIAHLNGIQTFTADNTFTSHVMLQNSIDSTYAFRIQNSAGNSNLFIADTTNTRIGIGTNTPGYTVDVNGDINISSGNSYRINGVAICGAAANCAPASGSSFYIQNSTAQQTAANFNILSANNASVGGIIRGAVGQTADLFRLQDENGANVASFANNGNLTLGQNAAASGSINFRNVAAVGDTTLIAGSPGVGSYTLSLPAENGTLCSTGSICAGYAASSGSGNYIQNGTALQTTANFAIQSAAAGSVGGVIRGAASQTADLLQFQNQSGVVIAGVDKSGSAWFGGTTSPGGRLGVTPDTAGSLGLVVQGRVSQTANLQEWQNSSGEAMAFITSAGELTLNGNIGGDRNALLTLNKGSGGTAKIQATAGTYSIGLIQARDDGSGSGGLGGYDYYVNRFGSSVLVYQQGVQGSTVANRFLAGNSAWIGAVVQGAASQTANLQEWQASDGQILARINQLGNMVIGTNTSGSANQSGTLTLQGYYSGGATATSLVFNPGGSNALISNTGSNSIDIKPTLNFRVLNGFDSNAPFFVQARSGAWSTGQVLITAQNPGTPGLAVQGAASQTANLQQWQDSTGAVLAKVDSLGRATFGSPSTPLSGVSTSGTYAGLSASSYGGTAIYANAQSMATVGLKVQSASALYTGDLQRWDPGGVTASSVTNSGFFKIGATGTLGLVEKLRVTDPTTVDDLANVMIGTSATTSKGLVIQGVASQTADLQQWQTSAGVVLGGINSAGGLYLGKASTSTGTTQFFNAAGAGSITLQANNPGASTYTLNLPAENGTLCSTGSVCAGYAASSGSGSYIQNGTTLQTTANFNIQSAAAGSVGGIIRGAASQTANLQEWQTSGAVVMRSVLNNGTMWGLNDTLIGAGTSTSVWNRLNFYNGSTGDAELTMHNSTWYLSTTGRLRVSQQTVLGVTTNPASLGTVEKLRVSNPVTVDNLANTILTASAATSKALVVQGFTSQSANLQEWQSSAGTVLNRIASTGAMQLGFNIALQGEISSGGTFVDLIKRGPSNNVWVGSSSADTEINTANNLLFDIGGIQKMFLSNSALTPASASGLLFGSPSLPWSTGYFKPSGSSVKGLVVTAAASQTAKLQQWENSSNTVLSSVDANGLFNIGTASSLNAANSKAYISGTTIHATTATSDNWTLNGVTRGTQFFTSESAATGSPASMSVSGSGYSGATIGTLGTFGYIGSFSGASGTGSRTIIGALNEGRSTSTISGDNIFGTRSTASWDNDQTGASGGTAYALYGAANTNTSSGGGNKIGYGVYGTSASSTNTTAIGGSFTATGVGTTIALQAISGNAASLGLLVKGAGSQTGDLQQWQNSSGTVLGKVTAAGSLQFYGSGGNPAVYGNSTSDNGIEAHSSSNLASKASLVAQPLAADARGVIVKGFTGQTANLQEWQDSTGAILAYASNVGRLKVASGGSAGLLVGTTAGLTTSADGGNLNINNSSLGQYIFINPSSTGNIYLGSTTDTATIEARRQINISSAADAVKLQIQGAATQTANLQEWQSNAGTVLTSVSGTGNLTFGASASSSTGVIRLQNATAIGWRNAANTADKTIYIGSNGATDALQLPGSVVVGGSDATGGAVYFFNSGVVVKRTAASGLWLQTTGSGVVLNSSGQFGVNPTSSTFSGGTVEKFRVNDPVTVDNLANTILTANAATSKPLVVQGFTSQSANLQEWQSSAGTVLNRVASTGAMQLGFNIAVQGEYSLGGSYVDLIKRGASNNVIVGTVSGADTLINAATNIQFATGSGYIANFINFSFAPNTTQAVTFGSASKLWANGYFGSSAAGSVGLNVLGFSGQTANLQQWSDSTNAVFSSVGAAGQLSLASTGTRGTVEKFRVNTPTTVDNAAAAIIATGADANKGLVIQANSATQSGNLLEIQTSTGALPLGINGAGVVNVNLAQYGSGTSALNIHNGGTPVLRVTHGPASTSGILLVVAEAATTRAVVVRGFSGQSVNLQEWQDSTSAVMASISATGDLTVKSGTFNGTLTVNGHIISGNTSGTTTAAAGAGAGTGASASVSGNDTAGVITVNTGTGAAAGIQATITFANAYGAAPKVVITPKDVPGGGIFPQYQYNSATGTFDLKTFNALTDSSTYTFSYQIIQ